MLSAVIGCGGSAIESPPAQSKNPLPEYVFDVHPGESIQAALDRAAGAFGRRIVRVHAGTYRPDAPSQALVRIIQEHDGVLLEAVGEVILTAANPDVADPEAASSPAIVNHVLYVGDGVTPATVIRGFTITGAKGFVTREGDPEPNTWTKELKRHDFFYSDGGGIKIFGRSYPTIEDVAVVDNFTSPCGAGISIEHRGFNDRAVTLRNCVFRGNRTRVTGSAVDVLPGSAVVIENSLFVGNVANLGTDLVAETSEQEPYNGENGSGALTVFFGSRAVVRRCTFTGNWNGLDDKGSDNEYSRCLFWQNTQEGGISPGPRYEIDILNAANVSGCHLGGDAILDLRGTIDAKRNTLGCPDPVFDADFRPTSDGFDGVGYRPAATDD